MYLRLPPYAFSEIMLKCVSGVFLHQSAAAALAQSSLSGCSICPLDHPSDQKEPGHHTLHLTAFSTSAGGWQTEPTNTAACSHTWWQHIVLIKHPGSDLFRGHRKKHSVSSVNKLRQVSPWMSPWWNEFVKRDLNQRQQRNLYIWAIQVCWVLHGCRVIAIVPVLNDWINDFSKHLRISHSQW